MSMNLGLAIALARAYNNWLVDFCKPYPDRLFPVAHIPLLNVEDAVTEMKRVARLGARGFYIRPDLYNGHTVAHPDNDVLWAEAQDLGLPVAPHVVARANNVMKDWASSMWPNEHTSLMQNNAIFTFTLSHAGRAGIVHSNDDHWSLREIPQAKVRYPGKWRRMDCPLAGEVRGASTRWARRSLP